MRLSTRSSVDLRQSIFTEALTSIMMGIQKRVKVQQNINMTITITVLIIKKLTIQYIYTMYKLNMGKSIMAQTKSLCFVIIALGSRKVKTEDKKLY